MTDTNKPDTINRVTPRDVEPDRRHEGGDLDRDRSTGDERSRGRSIRPDPERREAPGGDQAGIAGGGIDSNVSGLGGDKP